MYERLFYWAAMCFGTLSLLLVVVNISLVTSNRSVQAHVNERQATINKGVSLSQINQALVQALADASVQKNDKDIRDLLAAQGISVKADVSLPKSTTPGENTSKSPVTKKKRN